LVLPAAALLAVWLVRSATPSSPHAAPAPRYAATAAGETRELRTADGSRLHLSAQTRVAYALGGTQRTVELQQGEVFFEVARDAARPFVVTAGTTTVTVLGTVFDVNRVGERVQIQVYEGRVRVSDGTQRELHAGDSVWSGHGSLDPIESFDRHAEQPDWMRGWLQVREMPLGDVLAQLQRYAPHPIVLRDAGLDTLRVSGQLSLERPRESMALLAELQGLSFTEQDGRWVLGRQR
ncbi:MAG: FecR domain-containing protein, partial [Solimonas sp.]